ncbi:MAG: hypothetical protein ACTSRZ_12715 [Promethearchaeota archaeon]
MVRKILEERILTIPEVKQLLTNLKEKYGEEVFDSFQEITLDYAEKFSKIDVEKVPEIKKMLIDDYKMDEMYAVMLINIFPQTVEEIQSIFSKDPVISKMAQEDIQEMIYKMQDLAK